MDDYHLDKSVSGGMGLRQGLTSYGDPHFSLFLRKVFIKAAGYGDDALTRPIVGIINTFSGFNPCHAQVPQLVDAVKRGVHLAGGLAIDFPTISLHESFSSPTSMFLRNLMSMDTEEMIKAQPVDVVVAIGGCDKTVPAQIMGSLSANKPVLPLVVGPMMTGSFHGQRIGACTDCRNNWAAYRAGELDIEDIAAINSELAPTAGTCGVMGTASTMACICAALGMMPLEGASAPAVSAARIRIAESTGSVAVSLATDCTRRPQTVLDRKSFINAVTVLHAIGGSTNAVVHLLAIANRHPQLAGTITLDTINEVGAQTPLLVDLKPSGDNYMTDFHDAGGMRALLENLRPLLHLDANTVFGQTLGELLDSRPFKMFPHDPLSIHSLVALYGNIAPNGAIIKASASKDRRLLEFSGPAVVFEDTADLERRIDDPALEVNKDSILMLKGVGPVGNPGMPEAGMIPIPKKLKGVKDMLRISDGRMSGTAGGTIILHVSPESGLVDAPFGILRTGDIITCSLSKKLLSVALTDAEIAERIRYRAEALEQAGVLVEGGRLSGKQGRNRGYRSLYQAKVNQAHEGADFDFLAAKGEAFTAKR
ncbi:hypothetical protein D0862_11879 [Hortaea werneckii]|uniref:Dihydroxy-acid dehydratase n=1 Tax=Hortaea werneckii TaxID=91943 RepID=A0A3M7F2S9_HORWE|nr:hypothetical protein D0862_11879 [Hortaea werneckii]